MHALLRLLAPRHPPHALSSLAASFPRYFRSPKMTNSQLAPAPRLPTTRLTANQRHACVRSFARLLLFSGITNSHSPKRQLAPPPEDFFAIPRASHQIVKEFGFGPFPNSQACSRRGGVEVKQYRASGGVCKGTFPNSSHQRKSNRSFMQARRT